MIERTGVMVSNRVKSSFAACAAVLVALAAAPAAAQQYPSRPLRFVVPFSVAGASDAAARLMAQRMAPMLGQEIVVENRPGANGVIGSDAVAKAKPDGYTFLFGGSAPLAGAVVQAKNPPYQTDRDFAPVCRLGTISTVLVVNPSLGVKTVPELVALAKSRKEPLPYASPANGGYAHLSMEVLQDRTGINALNVLYKGTSLAITDVMAGHVPMMFESFNAVAPHVASGKLIALGTTSGKRLAGLPDVPTMQELGFPDFVVQGWAGLMLPAGTPKPIVDKLADACKRVLEQPDVVDIMLRQQGWEVDWQGPEGFGEFVRNELVKWAKMLASARVKVDQ